MLNIKLIKYQHILSLFIKSCEKTVNSCHAFDLFKKWSDILYYDHTYCFSTGHFSWSYLRLGWSTSVNFGNCWSVTFTVECPSCHLITSIKTLIGRIYCDYMISQYLSYSRLDGWIFDGKNGSRILHAVEILLFLFFCGLTTVICRLVMCSF